MKRTYAESSTDMISRLEMMADGDPTWDLSDNDRSAIRYALAAVKLIDALEEDVKREPLMLHDCPSSADWPKHPRGLGLLNGYRTLRKALEQTYGDRL